MVFGGDLPKCNVHFAGGGSKMYLGPPPRGFSRGGGQKKNIARKRPPSVSTFFCENVLGGVPRL